MIDFANPSCRRDASHWSTSSHWLKASHCCFCSFAIMLVKAPFFFFVKLPSQLTTRWMRATHEFVQHITKCNRLGNFLECILSLLNCSHFSFLATLGILYYQRSFCFHHLWNLSSACLCNYSSKPFEAWCWSLRHLPPSPQNDTMSLTLHVSFRIVHVVSWYGFACLFFVHKILPSPVVKHVCFCLLA